MYIHVILYIQNHIGGQGPSNKHSYETSDLNFTQGDPSEVLTK